MVKAQVEVREPGKAPRRLALNAGALEVGRECDGLVVADPGVSRRHLVLTAGDPGLSVADLGSTNGTTLNGTALTARRQTALRTGDVLGLAGTEIVVIETGEVPAAGPQVTTPSVPSPPVVDPTTPVAMPAPPPAAARPPADAPAASVHPPAEAPPPGRRSVDAAAVRQEPRQSPAGSAVRPALDELAKRDTDAAVIRYRPGSAGEAAASAVSAAARRARRRLAGIGSEPWGVKPQICLVDPFPDPDRPGEVVTGGTVVDPGRGEIWMVVSAESPPEPPERSLALLFGAALPAAAELGALLEGYGLHLAGSPDPDARLRQLDLPPLAAADGELSGAMGLSFVRYLLERANEDAFRRLLVESKPGRVDATATDVYGSSLAGLEEAWRWKLSAGPVKVRTGEFLRLALRYLRPHRRREAEMLVYMLAGLGFTMLFPFAVKRLFDTAIPSGELSQVITVLGFLAVAFAVSLLATLRRSYLAAYVSSAVIRQIRTSMYGRMQGLSTGWFGRHQQGDVLSRLISDVASLEAGLSETVREGFFQMLSLVVASVVLLSLDPLLGLIVLAGAPVVAVVYKAMSGGARKRSIAVQERMGGLISTATENFGAQSVVKAFALEARERARFGRDCDRLFDAQLRLQLFGGLFGLSVNTIVTVLRLAVLGLGAWLILDGQLTIGGLVAFLGLMGEVLSPVTILTGIGQQVQAATGALERVNEVLEAVPEIDDAADATPLPPLQHEIRLDGVSFSYTPERRILEGLDVVIRAGSRVAFVGPTGAGKSSVLQLLMRFADPDEGAVRFDGRDVRSGTVASLRGQLGVVFQESFLFDATIRDNIAMGKPNATDDEVEAAARAAELHEFIEELPRGYDTLVGERGGRLSGGQRQRLAIARALLRDPSVLILDEATSALDPRTERLIAATLERVGTGRTTISVTHRLNSVTAYDRIFVIVAGKLTEQGTHDELVRLGGVYAGLWAEQTGGVVATEAPFDAVAALGRVSVFAALAADDLDRVAARLRPVELAAGERLAEGGGRLALVRRGRAVVLAPGLAGGEPVAVAELGPGDAFGVSALLGQESGSMLSADGPVSLLLLDDEAIAALAALLPSVGAALEGSRPAGVAPAGGRRLSRMSLVPGTRLSLAAPPDAGSGGPSGPSADDVRRATGTFGAVGR